MVNASNKFGFLNSVRYLRSMGKCATKATLLWRTFPLPSTANSEELTLISIRMTNTVAFLKTLLTKGVTTVLISM